MVNIEHVSMSGGKPGDAASLFTEQERKLITILRKLDYGEVRVLIKNGAPVRVEEIKKSIKL